jgi:hypothetical protein
MKRLLLSLGLAVAACSDSAPLFMPDLGPDLSLPIEQRHVGATAPTAGLTVQGDYAFYLANYQAQGVDSRGLPKPAIGELHLATPWGDDWVLGQNVPVFAYGFTPDMHYAIFTTQVGRGDRYALHFARLGDKWPIKPVDNILVPDGLTSDPLSQQAFFSPSGRYYIVGVLRKNVTNISDLHIIDTYTQKDIFALGSGSFAYLEILTGGDTMVYADSTASTKAGVPSVQGMYSAPLATLAKGVKPVQLDTQVSNFTLVGDGFTILYTKAQNGDLWMRDIRKGYNLKLDTNVVAFSSGNGPRGPFVYVTGDNVLHVLPMFGQELMKTAPGSVDPFTSTLFSPDGTRLYYFNHTSPQNSQGDMWTIALPPAGDGVPHLVDRRVAAADVNFAYGQRMLYTRALDTRGETGELVAADWDGGNPTILASGVLIGVTREISPQLPASKPTKGRYNVSPDMTPPPPLLGVLADSVRDNSMNLPVDSSNPIVGTLTLLSNLRANMITISDKVHAGAYQFSSDGYDIVYIGDAAWDDNALNYVGKLRIGSTVVDRPRLDVMIDGATEVSPVDNRTFWVTAPNASPAGTYFIKY